MKSSGAKAFSPIGTNHRPLARDVITRKCFFLALIFHFFLPSRRRSGTQISFTAPRDTISQPRLQTNDFRSGRQNEGETQHADASGPKSSSSGQEQHQGDFGNDDTLVKSNSKNSVILKNTGRKYKRREGMEKDLKENSTLKQINSGTQS